MAPSSIARGQGDRRRDEHAPSQGSSHTSGAHARDVEVQDQYGVNYQQYWYNTAAGVVFCLVEAPNEEAAATVHRVAHGLVADEIVEISVGS